jgi:hypothetical protein
MVDLLQLAGARYLDMSGAVRPFTGDVPYMALLVFLNLSSCDLLNLTLYRMTNLKVLFVYLATNVSSSKCISTFNEKQPLSIINSSIHYIYFSRKEIKSTRVGLCGPETEPYDYVYRK